MWGHAPLGSVVYTNYPREGFYLVTGFRREHNRIGVVGKLAIESSFGYPDPSSRGLIISSILNNERSFRRNALDGRWELD